MKDCNQCGKCCTKYVNGGLSALVDEIELWEQFKPDIAKYVNNGNIWTDPETGKQLEFCPWLRQVPGQAKYTCDIYFDRPNDCKSYPVTIQQMIEDECEMLEIQDLSNTRKAQKKLNELMADSRPPYEQRF